MLKLIWGFALLNFAISETLFFQPRSGGKVGARDPNPLCPDKQGTCPAKSTCCKLVSGKYGCCPLPMAVCCSDNLHCCPEGFTCNVEEESCTKGSLTIDWTQRVREADPLDPNAVCPGGKAKCPSGNTCCKQEAGYGCCPVRDAVCCGDQAHCCPRGYTCDVKKGRCDKKVGAGTLAWLALTAGQRQTQVSNMPKSGVPQNKISKTATSKTNPSATKMNKPTTASSNPAKIKSVNPHPKPVSSKQAVPSAKEKGKTSQQQQQQKKLAKTSSKPTPPKAQPMKSPLSGKSHPIKTAGTKQPIQKAKEGKIQNVGKKFSGKADPKMSHNIKPKQQGLVNIGKDKQIPKMKAAKPAKAVGNIKDSKVRSKIQQPLKVQIPKVKAQNKDQARKVTKPKPVQQKKPTPKMQNVLKPVAKAAKAVKSPQILKQKVKQAMPKIPKSIKPKTVQKKAIGTTQELKNAAKNKLLHAKKLVTGKDKVSKTGSQPKAKTVNSKKQVPKGKSTTGKPAVPKSGKQTKHGRVSSNIKIVVEQHLPKPVLKACLQEIARKVNPKNVKIIRTPNNPKKLKSGAKSQTPNNPKQLKSDAKSQKPAGKLPPPKKSQSQSKKQADKEKDTEKPGVFGKIMDKIAETTQQIRNTLSGSSVIDAKDKKHKTEEVKPQKKRTESIVQKVKKNVEQLPKVLSKKLSKSGEKTESKALPKDKKVVPGMGKKVVPKIDLKVNQGRVAKDTGKKDSNVRSKVVPKVVPNVRQVKPIQNVGKAQQIKAKSQQNAQKSAKAKISNQQQKHQVGSQKAIPKSKINVKIAQGRS